MTASLKYTQHQYGTKNHLQKLGVWEPSTDTATEDNLISKGKKYWVIYIHGGAWRDPRITHDVFTSSIDHILASLNGNNNNNKVIAGFASIDYRLSPHPQFPQNPPTTPEEEYNYRGARHPDHINDVQSALIFLQATYKFGNNYILVGHSAGGALAFQLLATHEKGTKPALPSAIVAFEGLYDFTGINARFDGAYATFFNGAFGNNWDSAAPIKFAGNYADKWSTSTRENDNNSDNNKKGENILILGWSPGDTLVDEPEADNMARRLRDQDGFVDIRQEQVDESGRAKDEKNVKRLLLLKDLTGDHDEIWRDGKHVARMVWIALRKLGV